MCAGPDGIPMSVEQHTWRSRCGRRSGAAGTDCISTLARYEGGQSGSLVQDKMAHPSPGR